MIEVTPQSVRTWSILGTAGTFGLAAMQLPALNDETLIVTADLQNFSGLDRFAAQFPERLVNVGIAEQNMVGVAAGLQNEGFSTFATTYATFASARAADPVRVNMGYMQLGIKLVGMASGFSVGLLGPTHMGLEDIAFMRSIPNITVISPADGLETVKATLALANFGGPVYLRLGGGVPHPVVYRDDYDFEIGKGIWLREGRDVVIVACGAVVYQALQAAELLEDCGIAAGVINMHTIRPLDTGVLDEACSATRLLVTVEEHSASGGLGGAVAEYVTTLNSAPPQLILGVRGAFPHAGDYQSLLHGAGLSPPDLTKFIKNRFEIL